MKGVVWWWTPEAKQRRRGEEKRNAKRAGVGRNSQEQLTHARESWGWAEIDRPPFHQPPTHRVALRGARRRSRSVPPAPADAPAAGQRLRIPPVHCSLPHSALLSLWQTGDAGGWETPMFFFSLLRNSCRFLLDLFFPSLSGSSPCSPCRIFSYECGMRGLAGRIPSWRNPASSVCVRFKAAFSGGFRLRIRGANLRAKVEPKDPSRVYGWPGPNSRRCRRKSATFASSSRPFPLPRPRIYCSNARPVRQSCNSRCPSDEQPGRDAGFAV